MTPFETESLAISAAALWVAAASLVAQVAIGAGQIAAVWHGIRSMIASGQARTREHDQRHEESITARSAVFTLNEERCYICISDAHSAGDGKASCSYG